MKNLRRLLFLAIGLGLGFASCSPKYYAPNTQNVPLISQKGETNLTLSGNDSQVEFQGAYGVGNNFAIKANGGLFIPSDLDNGNGGSGKFIEFGGGYYKLLNTHLIFETYGILGFGSFENHLPSTIEDYPQTTGDISANLVRVGIQPNIGFKSKYFTLALSSRFVNLSYNNIEGDLMFGDKSQAQYLEDHSSNFLIEPALTVRAGLEKVKLQLQYGYSFNASDISFKQKRALLTMGLSFNFK